jgi:penicillin-binding protein 1A
MRSAKPRPDKLERATPPRSRRMTIALRVLKWTALGGLALTAVLAVTMATLFWVYGSDPALPQIRTLHDYRPKQVVRIVSADGKVIGEIFEERRSYVGLDKIAPTMVQAIIDSEDADFRTHEGLDFKGMIRAFWVNLRSGETKQGASTITQQVVKTFLLSPERTFKRKMQEIILARRLEQSLDKDEILTLYLNQIYFGHGRYGVEEASRFFFGKSAAQLDIGEAALLAGLPQSPERLSPLKHPEAAKDRQTYVLGQMVRRGHLPQEEAQRWISAPIRVVKETDPYREVAPEVVEIVREELKKKHGDDILRSGGTVKTTIDAELQANARAALHAGLEALDARHDYRGPLAKLAPDKVEKKLAQLKKVLPAGGPKAGDSYEAVVVSVSDEKVELAVDLGGWKGTVPLGEKGRYNPEGKKPSLRFAANDVVRVRRATQDAPLELDHGPQGAVVVIDPATRRVLAMVGGYAFQPGQFNRALSAKRQPGSAFKPIVYAAAFDTGQFTPATIMNDAPEVYDLWKPKNYEQGKFRGPIRLREALAHSINTIAIRVLHDIGPEKAVDLAHLLGIKEELPKELSLALGSGVVTPLELTNAFTTFATGGRFAEPVFLLEDGAPPPEVKQVMRPEVAYLTTSVMESVVEEGTATAAKKLKRRISGKTGTSNSGRDAWFVGFTPDLVAGVWVGFDDMRPLGKGEAGGKAALPIWIDMVKKALESKSPRMFRPPPGVVTVRIDKKTGKLAAPGQPDSETLDEVFLEGTAPTEVAPAPGEVDPSTFVLDQMESGEDAVVNSPPSE